jgi:hypothetical protein
MFYLYTVNEGLIVTKLDEDSSNELLAANNGSLAKIQCPEDHETVKYVRVVDDVCIAETQADIDAHLMDELRAERNLKLSASDWTQALDSPLTDAKRAEWRTYRQALRDLPENTTDPANPIWPVKPT